MNTNMRRFILVRDVDVSGVSGVGVVAEGVVFASGKAVMTWLTQYSSVAIYESIDDLVTIHTHGGLTRLEWIGDE